MIVDLKKYPFIQNGIGFCSLAKRSLAGEVIEVRNAKSAWIPFLVYCKMVILNVVKDDSIYDEIDITKYCKSLSNIKLRLLTETSASLTPLISDTLYQLDNKIDKIDELEEGKIKSVEITNWQSYGRSYITDLDKQIKEFKNQKKICLLLPCVGKRPYNHEKLNIENYDNENYHKVVLSSIGIIPEEFWNSEVVMKYNTGVPDIWRVFKLAKYYFEKNKYDKIICYLDYAPYIEIVEILKEILKIKVEIKNSVKYNIHGPKFAIK